MAFRSFIVSTDTHGELIDRDYERYILKFTEDHKPHRRYHAGDCFDMKAIRRGADDSERSTSLVEDFRAGLRFLKAFKPHVITWGNHDHRLWVLADSQKQGLEYDFARQLRDELENTVKQMRIETREYDVRRGWYEIAPGRLLGHGYKSNMYPAKANCTHWGSTITGHVHAFDYHRMDNLASDESYVSGCGCDIAQEYNRTHARRLKHEIGFLYGVACDKSGDWQVWQIKRTEQGKWLDPLKLTRK